MAADAPRPLAVGWATVELERAEREWLDRLPAGSAFRDAAPCVHLGARCRIVEVAGDAGTSRHELAADTLVLLEPSTEGRLAVTLARHGEGWCATWVAATIMAPGGDGPATDVATSAERDGPLGPERLVLGGPVHGPHRLVVRTATIEP